MTDQFVLLNGRDVDASALQIPKSRDLVGVLQSGVLNWARIVGCQLLDSEDVIPSLRGSEVIVFDVEVEVPQRKVYDIRRVEQIAVAFWPDDNHYPETLALRADFPIVPHCNLRPFEFPRSLCLYDVPYSEIKPRWTAPRFIEDLRTWLSRTADGTLHAEDQHLEPLLMGSGARIILPSDFLLVEHNGDPLSISRVDSGNNQYCLVAEWSKTVDQTARQSGQQFVAVTIVGSPQTHGIIHQQPLNLRELHEFLKSGNVDLCSFLKERLRELQHNNSVLGAALIVIVALPKTRKEGGSAEQTDLWAFICVGITSGLDESNRGGSSNNPQRFPTILEIGVEFDLWQNRGGNLGTVILPDPTKQGGAVQLDLLNPSFTLSRDSAARFNDLNGRYGRKIVGVGMGAIGSQIFLNLIRAAYGEWTIIDKDLLLPHNLARHALYGVAIGHSKAEPLAYFANNTIDGEPIATAIVTDILQPGEASERVKQSLAEAHEILDFSASIAVARHLSRAVESPARRASFFLNPQGTDSVMLVEDAGRQIPLSALEMQYYRLLVSEPQLHSHLSQPPQLRYAHSCRDISSTIGQDHVALHAAIGSRALRRAFESDGGMVSIWQSSDDGTVRSFSAVPAPLVITKKRDWTICADHLFLDRMRDLRSERLPNETGGVLIGAFDMQYKTVYVLDAFRAPPDSTEEPTGFVRGLHCLTEAVVSIEQITAGQLTYVGEWHSHPTGHTVRPSKFDRTLLKWLTERMATVGFPAVMLIVGGRNQYAWYFDKAR